MFDGVVRTLCDVRHVHDLRKNLISLGTLGCNGFSYKSTSGIMKVSKGAIDSSLASAVAMAPFDSGFDPRQRRHLIRAQSMSQLIRVQLVLLD